MYQAEPFARLEVAVFAALILTLGIACSDDPASQGAGGPTDGGTGEPGADGSRSDAATTGNGDSAGSRDGGRKACRSYPTRLRMEFSSVPTDVRNYTTTFDATTTTWKWSRDPPSEQEDIAWIYASVADFVEENKPAETRRALTQQYGVGQKPAETWTYDNSKRLVTEENHGSGYDALTTYTDWDGFGRPAVGNGVCLSGSGKSISVTVSYDDKAQSATWAWGDYSPDNCYPSAATYVRTFDTDGNLVHEKREDSAHNITEIALTFLAMSEVCR